MPETAAPSRRIPPLLFGSLSLPSGIFYWGSSALLIPYLMRKQGVPVDRIAEVVAIGSLPLLWGFLTSPLLDLGLQKRTWFVLTVLLTAIVQVFLVLAIREPTWVLGSLLFAGNLIQAMPYTAGGALMSTVEASVRGRAAGWFQAGNIGGGSLAGGSLIWLADHLSLPWLAVLSATLIALPALVVLVIDERPREGAHPGLRTVMRAVFRDVWSVLRRRRTWVGIGFFCSPVGSGALSNLIASIGPDYRADGNLVGMVTGAGAAAVMGLGCALGGWFCDRLDRKTFYSLTGIACASGASVLWLGSPQPLTYASGYLLYALATGMGFAAYSALVLEVVGGERANGAATSFALMSSAGNLCVIYMTWLDGIGYRLGGAKGLTMTETLGNAAGAIVLFSVARLALRRWPEDSDIAVLAKARAA